MSSNFKDNFSKRVYDYAVNIINFTKKLPNDPNTQILARQLLRSGTSVTANITEAQAASSKKDYINFYLHALKSANETKLWLNLLKDTLDRFPVGVESIIDETIEISKILGASVITMKKSLQK
ncbi:hypothetical protein A2917_02600 [Candidatus Nomurabacteria bacterium RIFCSPLOWO2_01_FULL_42_17]|uniref:Four helix bundle protein n=1 Tax=Candidatus Nomurabacteria bacterium RIFCSPLOWO2_01_FULL_42_17 TaxID=1801780 RepID=A0A1F6XMQ5_9BACT|nr:MAG: hypothetical protein A2917_02600 [Candidatus Nomurabacteria bacterium RIFCSPLOWO2_01_FULL_42_17]